MKILYVSGWPLVPCNSGGRQRSFQTIEFLRRRYSLQHLCFVSTEREKANMEACGAQTLAYEREFVNNALPPSLRPFDGPQIRERFEQLKKQDFQVTIFDHIFTASHWERCPGLPVLLEHNIESSVLEQIAKSFQGTERRIALAQSLALKAYENRNWPAFELRCCVSELDLSVMNSRCPDGRAMLVPNGVDLSKVRPLSLQGEPRLLFVGSMDYPPNADAVDFLCRQIMPRIWAQQPDMRLRVIGRKPPPSVYSALACDPRLELIADAPELEPLAQECSMSLVPLRMGGGTRLKILEAAAWGMPVVSTSLGCEGLRPELLRALEVADDAESLADKVISLWRDPQRREAQAAMALEAVTAHYDWPLVLEPLALALEGLKLD